MTGLFAQRSAPHSPRNTTELYRSCMILSEEARSLLVQNEGMKRLGLNAQVQAAQTSERTGGLEVIVSEIGRLSHAIREALEAMGEAAKFLSHASIEILHLAALDASYEKGLARGIDPRSADVYKQTYSVIRSRERQHLVDLKKRLRTVGSLVEDLGRVSQQISPVTTMIRIVVTEADSKTAELLGTVDELNSFHEHLDAKVEHMRRIREVCSGYIQELSKAGR